MRQRMLCLGLECMPQGCAISPETEQWDQTKAAKDTAHLFTAASAATIQVPVVSIHFMQLLKLLTPCRRYYVAAVPA